MKCEACERSLDALPNATPDTKVVCVGCWLNGWFIGAPTGGKEALYTARYVEKERPATNAEIAEWRAALEAARGWLK